MANLITIVRIFLAPIFIWLLIADAHHFGALRYAAAILFIVAIATDGIDGHIARSRNLVTDLGKILDPIADKVLTGGALIVLSVVGELPWWVTIVILVRELGITAYRFVALRFGQVIPASRGGKLKTLFQAIAISAALIPFWRFLGSWVYAVDTVLMSIAFGLTVLSGIDYVLQAIRKNRRTAR